MRTHTAYDLYTVCVFRFLFFRLFRFFVYFHLGNMRFAFSVFIIANMPSIVLGNC